MDYQQTLDFLFTQFPMFQNNGASAYKPGLDNALHLSELFGNPHRKLNAIHIAGTNGKGSTAHTLAAILQSAGYRTALFTSPHLVDFRERIRIDGEMIPESEVVDFVRRFRSMQTDLKPSFFELTTIMAFDWFARNNVDIAVIEAGLGGRLDTTNILPHPLLSVITNISFDHTALLGNTLTAIASEKAGIMKSGVPVVIGEAEGPVRQLFERHAEAVGAPIVFASDCNEITGAQHTHFGWHYTTRSYGDISGDLNGGYQLRNTATVLCAVTRLRRLGLKINTEAVREGFVNVASLTGLMGRWMKISDNPTVICDTGHNPGGWQYTVRQLESYNGLLRLVLGFVNDKDINTILNMIACLGNRVSIYVTQASVNRALPAPVLAEAMRKASLPIVYVASDVPDAYTHALADAVTHGGIVFVGGSTFVIADLLHHLRRQSSD